MSRYFDWSRNPDSPAQAMERGVQSRLLAEVSAVMPGEWRRSRLTSRVVLGDDDGPRLTVGRGWDVSYHHGRDSHALHYEPDLVDALLALECRVRLFGWPWPWQSTEVACG